MTLTRSRIASLLGGSVFGDVIWDSPMFDEESETTSDPGATYLIHAVVFQNLTDQERHAQFGTRTYDAPPQTPERQISIPSGQRERIDVLEYISVW